MSAYEPAAPRAALGVAAVAMAAVTIFTLVVLPAKLDSGGIDSQSPVTAGGTTAPPVQAAATPARADAPDGVERKKQFALSAARPYGNGNPTANLAY
ncbi:MAG TPA: hypothetical protein VGK37_09815 [Casimicrobiaceae bacterium]